MNTYEQLIAEWLTMRGFVVVVNEKVGRSSQTSENRSSGGWDGELDVLGWNPITGAVIHFEPSLDAHPWDKREERAAKKFVRGRVHIRDIPQFSHLTDEQVNGMRQYALFYNIKKGLQNGDKFAGGHILSLDGLMAHIKAEIGERGLGRNNAIPAKYPLLRFLQLSTNGYAFKPVSTGFPDVLGETALIVAGA